MSERLLGAVDLGSSKVAALIADIDPSGMLNVRGVGIAPSRGVRQGVVVDLEEATEAVIYAVDLAEDMAGAKMPPAQVGISGDHVGSINCAGSLTLRPLAPGEGGCVDEAAVEAVLENAQSVQLPLDKCLLHVIPQAYEVDGRPVRSPVGQSGFRLAAETHLVLAGIASRSNLQRVLQAAGLRAARLTFSPLAATAAVVRRQELEHGVALVDIGAGVCEAAFVVDGALRHTWVHRYAGERVTRDVAMVLKTSLVEAERIKVEAGLADPRLVGTADRELRVPDVNGSFQRSVHQSLLARIIGARLQEIFQHLAAEATRLRLRDQLAAGVVLTGGTALTPGIAALAARELGLPVRTGRCEEFLGPKGILATGAYSTALGLLLHGARTVQEFDREPFPALDLLDARGPAGAAPRGLKRMLAALRGRRPA
jgi:cell division protein FtsA